MTDSALTGAELHVHLRFSWKAAMAAGEETL